MIIPFYFREKESGMLRFILTVTYMLTLLSSYLTIAQDKNTIYKDEVFTDVIKSIQLFPRTGANGQQLQSPIIPLSQPVPLLLRFDLLKEDYDFLRARLVHCDYDWKKSNLSDIEFLQEFNLFEVLDYAYSGTAKQLYVNYEFELPKVKISGNYALVVYQNNDPDDILFIKRFVVFERLTQINPNVRVSTSPRYRMSHQQIDFAIGHGSIRTSNPRTEIKVVVRQNRRWDNAIYDLQATRMDMSNKRLEYMPFQGENSFLGGNEFRFFDIRTVTFRGQFMEKIDKSKTPTEAWVTVDESRQGRVYAELNDLNGGYYLDTNEIGAEFLDADYVKVNFRLKTEASLEPIYVIGAFNSWRKDGQSKMEYNAEAGQYQKQVLLKQGLYDYQYWVDGDNPLKYDGSFTQTNNEYEIIVYYKSFTDRYYRAVGFGSFLAQL